MTKCGCTYVVVTVLGSNFLNDPLIRSLNGSCALHDITSNTNALSFDEENFALFSYMKQRRLAQCDK